MQGFYFLKSSVAKAVRDSGIDLRLCLKKNKPKKALRVQQLYVLVGKLKRNSEYLAYGIDLSMNTKSRTKLILCRLCVLKQC